MRKLASFLGVWLVICNTLFSVAAEPSWQATGKLGAVATGTPQAADAGLSVLRGGGNAVDAAVATLLVLSVTDPGNFCFGGEVPIIVYDSQRRVVEVLCGQGAAPRLATLEHFQKKGGMPPTGTELATVPGALDAMLVALDRYGTISFGQAAQPMLDSLDQKKDPTKDAWCIDLAKTIRELSDVEKQSPDRRRGLRLIADHFYRGPIARRLDAWSRTHGGLLRYTDLATHITRIEEPVSIDYRGHTILKCGVWTQGPCLLEALKLLEGFDVASLQHNSADAIHLSAESLKLALADRDQYYADPLYVDVPLQQLLSEAYAERRRPLIDLQQASLEVRPGDPIAGKPLKLANGSTSGPTVSARDTTTCLVADRWGNVVAATPSGWGGTLAGNTGIQLGSRLRSLNTWPGHPNCIEPGKRPRITLTPTLVMKDGQPLLAISVAGGDLQDQVSLQVLLNCLDFRMSPSDAVTTPRFSTAHHTGSFLQPPPKLGSLTINEAMSPVTIEALRSRGHEVQLVKTAIGNPSALWLDAASGEKQAVGDPAAKRVAVAY